MCLYPKLIPNKRYLPTKKNGGVPPVCPDERLRYVTAACGDCYECRKQKQRQWVVRMSEENRQTPNAYFLTLTIDDKSYKQQCHYLIHREPPKTHLLTKKQQINN